MILDTSTVDRDVTLDADVCIIGSGAGGAVAAKELAERGKQVVVLERGPYVSSRAFTQREEQMLPLLYGDIGLRSSEDSTVAIIQGRTLGGSTVASQCVCVRLPRELLRHWVRASGLSLRFEDLAPCFEKVEAAARVRQLLPQDLNRNNEKLKVGAERLGYRHYLPSHNRSDCVGCGFCALGCAYDRKGDALTVHLPDASRRGAMVIPDCEAEQIETRDGRAVAVHGRFLRSFEDRHCRLTVRAAAIVLAAGAIASPALWLRSQLPDTYQQVGRNLHLQPEVMLGAAFGEEVAGWRGIPQAIIIDEFLDLDRRAAGGYLLMPTFVHPITLAALLPGCGADAHRLIGMNSRLALASVVLHDRTAGRVTLGDAGAPVVSYHLSEEDRVDLLNGMRRLADIYFASGAQRVVLPYNDLVELTQRGDYRAIDQHPFRANDPQLVSYRPQGTLRMGDRRRAVVDLYGEAHEVKSLFVADASVFPSSTAVPPQLSVMAFALRTAQHIAEAS